MAIIDYNKDTNERIKTYKGCVIALREHNGYDDSDFFAEVYDESTGTFKEICYASTRYYCTATATVDATEEVKAKYRDLCKALDRDCLRHKAKELWAYRHALRNAVGITFKQLNRLFNAYGRESDAFYGIIVLLKTNKFRSEFRKKLAGQVRTWLDEEHPKYNSPLSRKQIEYVHGEMGDVPGAIKYNVGIHGIHMMVYCHYSV